jgi:hypothetical protein
MSWSTPFVIATIAAPTVPQAQAQSQKPCLPGKDQLDIGRAQAMTRTKASMPLGIDWSKMRMPPFVSTTHTVTRTIPERLTPCSLREDGRRK